MLQWQVRYVKDSYPYLEVHKRKRRQNRNYMAVILIVSALLILLFTLPAWIIVVMACAALISLGIFMLCF